MTAPVQGFPTPALLSAQSIRALLPAFRKIMILQKRLDELNGLN